MHPKYSLLCLAAMVVAPLVSSTPLPEPVPVPEPKHKHKYPGPIFKHDKHERVDMRNVSKYSCVYDCVISTSWYLDVEDMDQHHFCRKKGWKVDKWNNNYLDPCLDQTCDLAHQTEIEDDINFWYADFCDFPFGK